MSTSLDDAILDIQPLEANALKMFFASLAPLRAQFEAPDLAEIMINSYKDIWIEHRGELIKLDVVLNPHMLEGAILALAASVDKSAKAGTSKGIINAGHQNIRVAAVMRPTAIDGHAMSIRKHRDQKLALSDYVRMGAFSIDRARTPESMEDLFAPGVANDALMTSLCEIVRRRKNILVAGGTSSGKTTFLNALAGAIPATDRTITIEDTMELQLSVPNKVRLLSNADTQVSTQLLVALCLRFRPDRIVVGEVRHGEAYDFIQALSTGHDGGMGSIHANTARGGLSRLESLAMLGTPPGTRWELSDVRKNIADVFNYVIHMKRTGELRHISEIIEIQGFRDNDYVFKRVF
ncbi:CpaF family protein (plasmid) [Robbsia andropogonis]|uniref:CpaF family protein n=1 Tax=Robbsia andropogonis TaxID=28092 RepID=UPI003D1B10D7